MGKSAEVNKWRRLLLPRLHSRTDISRAVWRSPFRSSYLLYVELPSLLSIFRDKNKLKMAVRILNQFLFFRPTLHQDAIFFPHFCKFGALTRVCSWWMVVKPSVGVVKSFALLCRRSLQAVSVHFSLSFVSISESTLRTSRRLRRRQEQQREAEIWDRKRKLYDETHNEIF